ncbi:MAG: PQQ-binding-like beta-propeller repeat protein [Planctomycetota bacterium]|nr:PQQ-binding-like beta-propeller repeat protein [Planctomycetota bacterium]
MKANRCGTKLFNLIHLPRKAAGVLASLASGSNRSTSFTCRARRQGSLPHSTTPSLHHSTTPPLPHSHTPPLLFLFLSLLLLFTSLPALHAEFEYELQLVPYDDPSGSIEDRIQKSVTWTMFYYSLTESQREAWKPPLVCWPRGILLDNKPLFEIYERGAFIDRKPIARPKLGPGTHTIWPGNHVFTIEKDGTVKTEDPELAISVRTAPAVAEAKTEEDKKERLFQVIKIKSYPVKIQAKSSDPSSRTPENLFYEIALPDLVIRDVADQALVDAANETKIKRAPRELLPDIRPFLFLTTWLPAHTSGAGYVIYPLKKTFHVSAKGIEPGAGEGGIAAPGWKINDYEITIPMNKIPVFGDEGMDLLITDIQKIDFGREVTLQTAHIFRRQEPYEFRVSLTGPSLLVDGDLDNLPIKAAKLDWTNLEKLQQRLLVVETESRHLRTGQTLKARIRGLDPSEAAKMEVVVESAEQELEKAQGALKTAQGDLNREQSILNRHQPKVYDAERKVSGFQQQLEVAQKTLETQKAADGKSQKDIDIWTKKVTDLQAELKQAQDILTQEGKAVENDPEVKDAKAKVAVAQAEMNGAEAKLAASEKNLQDQKDVHQAVGAVNLLADARPFAQLRAYGGKEWKELDVAGSEVGTVQIALAGAKEGVHELRLGLRPLQSNQKEIYVDRWVTLAAEKTNGVGTFTMRGRRAFYRGERFSLCVSVIAVVSEVPAGTPLIVELVDVDAGQILLHESATREAVTERKTFILDVSAETSGSLAPGDYRVEARIGDRQCPPFSIRIVDPAPETHFTNLLLGKYNEFFKLYSSVMTGKGLPADDVARAMVESGYNAFKGMTYAMENRVHFPDGGRLTELLRERPELGPWEAFTPASGRDQFLDACVKHNLRFYENIFTQHDSIMPRGDKMLEVVDRYTTLEAQRMRHSPAFRGICLFDELSQSLDHDSHMAVLAYFHRADELKYRERHNGTSSSQALRALDRFTARPEGQRRYEDVELYRTWPQHLDWQWENLGERMARSVKEVMPDAFNFYLGRCSAHPGSTLSLGNGSHEGMLRHLEAGSAVGYKDMGGFGDFPASGPLGADAQRVNDRAKVWPMLFGLGSGPNASSNLRHAFFALSQKVDGFSFMQFESSPEASPNDHFAGLRDITASLTTPYGDLFLALEKGFKKVAIVYSREADLLSSRKPIAPHLLCEGLWAACMRAGFPADFLTDEQLRANNGMDYEVVFMPGIHFKEEVHPESMAALRRLSAAGKKIVVERQSRLDIDGLIRLDSDLDEIDDRSGGSFPKYLDHDDERWWNMTVKTAEFIRSFLSKHISPAAEHSLLVGPDWQRCRQGEYLFIPNLAFAGFTGNHKTLYQAPDTPTLKFPTRPPVCYDILEMKRVEAPISSDGKSMSLRVDFRQYPGKIFAFLPGEIAAVTLRLPEASQGGQVFSYEVFAADAEGNPVDAGIPFEITITAPGGRVIQHLYRAGTPTYRSTYILPANIRSGSLKLRAREWISGKWAEAEIQVQPGNLEPAKLDDRMVRIHDASRVKRFVEKDVTAVQIPFKMEDILYPGRLAIRIRDGQDKLSQDLKAMLSPESLALFQKQEEDKEPSQELLAALLAELNKVVLGHRLYTDERFPPGILAIETGRLGQTVSEPTLLPDLHRLLLEEYYSQEIIRSHPVYLAAEEPWALEAGERLRLALHKRGIRTRLTRMEPFVRTPGVMVSPNQEVNIDGTRLWRGEVVLPGKQVDGPLILLGRNVGLVSDLQDQNLLPEPISENFPGQGRSIVCWVHEGFSNTYETIAVLATDKQGLSRGIDALLEGAAVEAEQVARAPAEAAPFLEIAPLRKVSGEETSIRRYGDVINFEDKVESLDVDEATERSLAGTFGYGHNLFCFAKDGELLWKKFLPEHDVYFVKWIDGGKKVIAATGHGFDFFLLDGNDGAVLKRFASTEWPNFHVEEREHRTHVRVTLNPKLRQVLVTGNSGTVAMDYDGKKMWFYDRAPALIDYPQKAVQTSFATFGQYLRFINIVPSPDGTKLAYNEMRHFASMYGMGKIILPLWRNEPQILDARTGQVLLKNISDPGASDEWQLTWPAGSEHPWIHASNLSAPLFFTSGLGALLQGANPLAEPDPGKLGKFVPPIKPVLKIGGTLLHDFQSPARIAESGGPIWAANDDVFWIKDFDIKNESDTRLYRTSRDGLVRCLDLQNGATIWEHKLPIHARMLPVGEKGLIAGARNGRVTRFGERGEVLWHKRLKDLHQVPESNYPEYIALAKAQLPDHTDEFYPVNNDTPDDYRDVLRMGIDQLEDGGFESAESWKALSGEVVLDANAHSGKKSLHLATGQLVTSAVQRKVIPNATYLLEFFYRSTKGNGVLAAGASMSGEDSVYTISNFKCGSIPSTAWSFGRVAVKSMSSSRGIEVGFEASGSDILVDTVRFRPVRYPSANLVFNAELHKIQPTHPEDYRIKYNRIPGELKNRLLSESSVSNFLQAVPLGALVWTQEAGFLFNGRLDDLTPMWSFRPDPIGFAVVLKKPAYVSHLVLHLNNAMPEMVYRQISILANDMTTKIPKTLALVRGNRRRFIVVHLPETVYTDNLKILPGHYRSQRDSLTEVEVYGPVGGPETLKGKKFADDPQSTPMFMGNPAHVPVALPEDLVGKYKVSQQQNHEFAPALHSQVTVVHDVMTFARSRGTFEKMPLTKEKLDEFNQEVQQRRKDGEQDPLVGWRTSTVTPLTTPARYAGRLLAGSADYKMHAVADNGAHIWAYKTGGRVYSSPTPDSDEVYFGSDDGLLHKVDVDSGILIWEFKTGDRVRSSPALDSAQVYFASWDGNVYCVNKARGTEVWKASIAPFTRSSPAIHNGRIYIGDEEGNLHCLNATDGKPFWKVNINPDRKDDHISICPVVVPEGIVVNSERGDLALFDFNGGLKWKKDVFEAVRAGAEIPPMLNGQPIATKTQVVLSSNQGIHVIRRSDGNPDTRFIEPDAPGNVVSVAIYGNKLCIVRNNTHIQFDYSKPRPWTRFVVAHGASAFVWEPEEKK